MYDQYVFGKRFYTPYIVSDSDIDKLRKKFRGKETKVLALVITVQNEGYLTQQDIADIAGITRMTLYRWRTTDRTFQREYDRLSNKAEKHYRKESRKRSRKIKVSEIMSDDKLYRLALGL